MHDSITLWVSSNKYADVQKGGVSFLLYAAVLLILLCCNLRNILHSYTFDNRQSEVISVHSNTLGWSASARDSALLIRRCAVKHVRVCVWESATCLTRPVIIHHQLPYSGHVTRVRHFSTNFYISSILIYKPFCSYFLHMFLFLNNQKIVAQNNKRLSPLPILNFKKLKSKHLPMDTPFSASFSPI